MNVVAIVQRYGTTFSGGSEAHCRLVCEQLVKRGHSVHVVTSTAVNHVTWANELPPGTTEINGVTVTRLSVAAHRDIGQWVDFERKFQLLSPGPTLADQQEFLVRQGPVLDGFDEWFQRNGSHFDVSIFFTYLWWPTAIGLPLAHPFLPTVLQPTAHDEQALYFKTTDRLFDHTDAFAFGSLEEKRLVELRYGRPKPSVVTGIGFEVGDAANHSPSRDPYLLYVGRIEELKGVSELVAFYDLYRRKNSSAPRLVLVGEGHMELPEIDGMKAVGFVSDERRAQLIEGCLALIQPSFLESFSMVLCEAWAFGRPVIVNGRCAVLSGQVGRSRGGFAYRDYFDFAAAIDLLVERPNIATAMGAAGRDYVVANYNWDAVVDRYESVFEIAIGAWTQRFAPRHVAEPQ